MTPLKVEKSAENFSAEDGENVSIPVALPAIAYEFYPSLLAILKEGSAPLKTLTFELLDEIQTASPDFLTSMKRLGNDIFPRMREIFHNGVEKENMTKVKL